MAHIRKLMKTKKVGHRRMSHIVYTKNKKQMRDFRRKNKHKFKTIFYGSPRKDTKGYYALMEV